MKSHPGPPRCRVQVPGVWFHETMTYSSRLFVFFVPFVVTEAAIHHEETEENNGTVFAFYILYHEHESSQVPGAQTESHIMNRDTVLAILFADIAQSTRLYEILGDEAAQNLIGACISRLIDVAARHGGTVIKTIGDEVMCTFPEARAAVEAARGMHEALEERFPAGDGPGISPNLHVGIHLGPVIREENDVFGDAVNVAARLVKIAASRQILISRDLVEAIGPSWGSFIRDLGRIPLRGKAEDLPIFEFVWEQYDMTIIADHALVSHDTGTSMKIRLGARHVRVSATRPSITLGRDKHCDLVLPGNHVSRIHAKIEYVAGKFFLSDQSSNGTYVSFQGGESVYLRRDKVVLYGTGTISPGLKPGPDTSDTILFQETASIEPSSST